LTFFCGCVILTKFLFEKIANAKNITGINSTN